MTHVAEHRLERFSLPPIRSRRPAAAQPDARCRDRRWPAVAAALAGLRAEKRRSVRIVDIDCGAGTLLLCAVRYARTLGFTAIEARGIDTAAALVGRASASASVVNDAAIGITFERANIIDALEDESAFPADIVMWHGCAGCSVEEANAVACAGRLVIADPDSPA
ncbi:SAM-dependent methyltransferase [Sphingomonas bacterium]|uniref:SAM-dependent methyltransferase n=1 Tax=Sphingomonas bacterium TaxID=1895847 RepID=UPI0020C6CB74|nr:SAM-dependent methyltransferase [Sphingomonas bacterium]